jgi:hypothetical protein
MTACEGMEVQFHANLTYALDGGEWSASCPLTPGERDCGTHYVCGCLGTRADVEATKRKKKAFPLPGIEFRFSSLKPVD